VPISLHELKAQTKKGSLYNGKLNFTYKLHGQGVDRLKELLDEGAQQEAEGATSEQVTATLELFCDDMVSWDLLGDNDQPVPLTPQGIQDAGVPWDVIGAISRHITENRNPQQGRRRS
jgi:hypothetical protein